MNIKLDIPKVTDLKPRISVIGIGGAGCNAINNMISTGLEGVEFVAANTDAQALAMSSAERQIQLGAELTEGLGAGARPEIGRGAAEEAIDDIRAQIEGCHMVFLAAGMGGGTGTGAISVIARVAREMDILTVAIVSKPFQFEGSRRMRTAEDGIKELSEQVDTLIVIPNQNLFRIANQKTTFAQAFVLADQVLYSGIACIVDLIVKDGLINLDFADVKAVMKGMGSAMMGTGEATGEDRATLAAEKAIANPLLDEITLRGARGLLISIIGGPNLTLFEVDEAASRVKSEAHPDANIIVGASFEDEMDNKIRVSIVAAGLRAINQQGQIDVVESGVQPAPVVNRAPFSWGSNEVSAEATSNETQNDKTDQTHEAQYDNRGAGSVNYSTENQSCPERDEFNDGSSKIEAVEGTIHDDRRQMSQSSVTMSEAAPPPIPAQTQDGSDPYLGDTPAEEFARALEDVIKSVAGEGNGPDDNHDPDWISPDGITIREGLANTSHREASSLPHHQSVSDYHDGNGFEAQQPADMPRRVPDVSQYPPITQQEYETRQDDPSAVNEQPAQPSRGMPSLLRRIAGFGRQGANLTDSTKHESDGDSSMTNEQQFHNDGRVGALPVRK